MKKEEEKTETLIKTFEEACEKTGRNPNALPDVSMLPKADREAVIAYYKLMVIAEALNDDKDFPNWDDDDQYKYYPWFAMDSARGFSCVGYVFVGSISLVGSRLCFKSIELTRYAGTQFVELYKLYFKK